MRTFIDTRKSVLLQPHTYNRLRGQKNENDTFDLTINRLISLANGLRRYAGVVE